MAVISQSVLADAPARFPNLGMRGRRWSWRLPRSLRFNGLLALSLLVAYLGATAWYAVHQRGVLERVTARIDVVREEHELASNAARALTHALTSVQATREAGKEDAAVTSMLLDYTSFSGYLDELARRFPESAPLVHDVDGAADALAAGRPGALDELRQRERRLVIRLEAIGRQLDRGSAQLSGEYNSLSRWLTAFVFGASAFGLIMFGVGVAVFLSRLSRDVSRLEGRAIAVADGYRGEPLEVTRQDEVGGLMRAINRMQQLLREREAQQQLSQQQRFHQEKMAAVGSLAAAVAHEVNNPINSISGIAQYTLDILENTGPMDAKLLAENARLVISQAERIAAIVRQIADLSAPHSPEPETLNVNELVRSTTSFVRYDPRLRRVEVTTRLDPELPALTAVADHLTQVLMNLLINAADALEGLQGRAPAVTVTTRTDGDEVCITVEDNGHGMPPEVLAQAFEQSFTTKPVGKGRGIGLYLCKTLIARAGGRLSIASKPGCSTCATVRLPVGATADGG